MSAGPIDISFLTPYVEDAINSPESPVNVKIEDTVLTWGGWERAVDIVARNVVVASAEAPKRPVARLPEVSFNLSLRALTQGIVAPTTLEILRPKIAMRRMPSGAFGLTLAPSAMASDEALDDGMTPLDEVLSDLNTFIRPPKRDHVLGYLTRLSIYNASGGFRDYHSGKNWRMDNFSFDLLRDSEGVEVSVLGQIAQGSYTGAVEINAAKPFASETGVVTFESPGFHLGLLQGLVPEFDPGDMDKERIALSGQLSVRQDGMPLNWRVDMSSDDLGVIHGNGVTIDSETGAFQSQVSISKFSPAKWAKLSPLLARGNALSGDLTADISVSGNLVRGDLSRVSLDEGRLSLVSDSGSINLPEIYSETIAHNGFSVEARFSDAFDRIEVSKLRLDLPEGLLVAGAETDMEEGQRRLSVSAELTDFNMAHLDKYWPPELGKDARVWVVQNITEGPVSKATFNMDGTLGPDGNFVMRDMGGEITLDKGVVNYFRPLPPATNVSGFARYGTDWFDIDVRGGQVGDINIEGGKIKITGIGTDDWIDVGLDMDGPFRDALELVDHEPLRLVSDIGFDPATLSGGAKGHAQFKFPLLNDLKAEQVRVQVDAQLTDLVMQNAFKDLSARGKALEMSVNNDGFQVDGEVLVAGVPLIASWEENFSKDEPLRKRLAVQGTLNESKLAEIGYNLIPYLDGDTDVSLESREYRDGHNQLDLTADLTGAGLLAPPLNWMKPRTFPAELALSAEWSEGAPLKVQPISFKSDTLSFKGSAALEADQETIRQVLIEDMQLNGAEIGGSAVREGDDGKYVINLHGDYFDVSGLVDMIESGIDGGGDEAEDASGVPFVLNSRFGVITAGPARRLLDMKLSLNHDGDSVQYLDLAAQAKDGSPIAIRYGLGDQGYVLSGTLDNAGSALRSIDAFDGIEGGRMTIQGLRPTKDAPLAGKVKMDDFVLVKAPAMAKVLEFMSLTGTLNSLTSKGLPFSNFQADYSLKGSELTLNKARVFGNSIGVSMSGVYDIKHDRMNARGTVVPAYAINRAIGAIPLVGWLLTGGEDGGFFGANYSVSGPLDDPQVQVNPLSALTPGALRRLFDIFPNNPGVNDEETKNGGEKTPPPLEGGQR